MNPAPQLELAAEPTVGTKRTRGPKRAASTALATASPTTVASVPALREEQSGSVALMRMIEKAATDPTFDVAKLEKLLEVKERWEKEEARKAFVAAFAEFEKEDLTIIKDKSVSFGSGDKKTEYDHASLAQVVRIIKPALGKHGISHNWQPAQETGGVIKITCVLTHVAGHSKEFTLSASPDQSGGKNNIQAVGSTVSYLQRYTLLCATGLSTTDQDDDARGSVGELPTINVEQKEELIALFRSTEADVPKFLTYFKIKAVDALPVAQFDQAKALLEEKGKRKSGR